MCLQETKLSSLTDAKCFSLWGDNNIGWVHYEGLNGAGSLVTMWRKTAFSYDNHVVGAGYIAVMGQHLKTGSQCVVVNIYAPCSLNAKVGLWEVLTTLKQQHQNQAWVFC